MPEGGYLSDSTSAKSGWRCLRGYKTVGQTCEAIAVPKHGYLSGSPVGLGWECERGYQALAENCRAIAVPENAHLNYTGDGWDCDRPYRERDGQCTMQGSE